MLKKLIILMIVVLAASMLAAMVTSLKIKEVEKEINKDYEEIRKYEYRIQGLKGQFNALSTPEHLERLSKTYMPHMHSIPLRDNVFAIPLKMGIKPR